MTMTQRRIFVAIAFLCLVLPLTASAQQSSEGPTVPPVPEAAAPIYSTRCANCHGPTGEGDGSQAVQVGLAMPDLTDAALARERTPAQWFDIISNGVEGKEMPPFGAANSNPLRQTDLWNLAFYMYTFSTAPEQVAMGQALYDMNCIECHGPDGAGDADTPGFTDLVAMANVSQADLFGAIADTTVEGHDLGLGEVEIRTLADYVRIFSYGDVLSPEVVASTATTPFSGGEGVVSGRVINGTTGSTIPEGLEIRLRAFDMNANFIDVITTSVATDGSFRFEGIDPTVPVQLEPRTVYQDISYYGDLDTAIMLLPEQPEANANITIYETTEDASAVRLERLHIVFDFVPGRMQVVELYILANDGDRTYVGTLEEGTMHLTVPANALSFQPGGDPSRYLTLADGIADTIPIPPGEGTAESILVYEMAYEDGMELSRPMPYDASIINLFVPDVGIEISGDGIQPGGPFQTQDVMLQTYLVNDLAAGDRLTLRLSGEPQVDSDIAAAASPHRSKGPNDTQSIAIGLGSLVGALALSYVYWQGHLKLRFRPIVQDRQSILLQAIADLDDDFEAGRVKKKQYQTQRTGLKQELIELMEAKE